VDSQGRKKQPIMLHRVILGSLERFIGALLEHYKGSLPLWLSPTQVLVVPINPVRSKPPEATATPTTGTSNGVKDVLREYGIKVKTALEENSIRTDIDSRNETLDKRIRQAELNKIPYCLVVGEREAKQETVSVRKRGAGDVGAASIEQFIKQIRQEIENKVT